MSKGKPVDGLPYRVRVYINNQVLLPAMLVRVLNIEHLRYANIVIRYDGNVITLDRVLLLRARHTASRQFTIPKEVREKYGIKPFDEIEILSIKPAGMKEVEHQAIGH
ncbi:AbrB/MazE/SpoVT family DNA-binding domain-containing protein [Vulcanisaeta sp. JCM 14467]|uniref:AbrB/MazE/SpoVT family DNA-binding domain-containing protein n=1 Tax=Vulcanisaeta sp. JCM 14467 TaxID=1295370 RepID=UPI0006D1608A|nr:AbrB/MazE/SpoVT family DNA-binding domain-containing protein [Vulcanisaeta sp. JCM 14467]